MREAKEKNREAVNSHVMHGFMNRLNTDEREVNKKHSYGLNSQRILFTLLPSLTIAHIGVNISMPTPFGAVLYIVSSCPCESH